MASLQEKYEMKLMILTDLIGVCKKLSVSSALTEQQRVQVAMSYSRSMAKPFQKGFLKATNS
jgi:hypothetical protein